ncbi:MAG: VOC family protein [Candidatus Saccharimonadales bacterium]|jgi:predicted enzyme related to lactoylglutathione lyase
MLKLNSLLIGSDDPKQLAHFYGEVLQVKPSWDDNEYIGYQAGESFLMIGPHDKVRGKSPNPERVIFNFETANVADEFERIKGIEGASVVKEPYHPGEADQMLLATLADPDDNYFQLTSPM